MRRVARGPGNRDRLTHATQDNRTRYENALPGFVSCAESRSGRRVLRSSPNCIGNDFRYKVFICCIDLLSSPVNSRKKLKKGKTRI